MDDREFTQKMKQIITALCEKRYDPYEQLRGYVLENDPRYITRHNGARELMCSLDMDDVKNYLKEKKQWSR